MPSIGSLSAGKLAAAYAGSTDATAARPAPERAERAEEKRAVARQQQEEERQEPARDANATQGTLVDTYL